MQIIPSGEILRTCRASGARSLRSEKVGRVEIFGSGHGEQNRKLFLINLA
jgi:hypothetical protein